MTVVLSYNVTALQLTQEVNHFVAQYPWIWNVEKQYGLPQGLLLAVGSRETNLTNEVGSSGGYGVWQLQGPPIHVIPTGFMQNIPLQAQTAAAHLQGLLTETGGNVDTAANGYNVGHPVPDGVTAGGNYGTDVIQRMNYIQQQYNAVANTTSSPSITSLPNFTSPAGLGQLVLADIYMNGAPLIGNVQEAVTDVILTRTMAGASTVVMQMTDPTRTILNSGIFNLAATGTNPDIGPTGTNNATLELDGTSWRQCAFTKAGDQLQITFESAAIYALQQQINATGTVVNTTATSTDIQSFVQGLVSEVPGLNLICEPTQLQAAINMARGSAGNLYEDSWTCILRIATSAGWRAFESNNTIYVGTDPWFQTNAPKPYPVLTEFIPGIQNMDFEYDIDQPFGQITITAMLNSFSYDIAGGILTNKLGPCDGQVWLVYQMQRDLYSPEATITLQVPLTPTEILDSSGSNSASNTSPGVAGTGTSTTSPVLSINNGATPGAGTPLLTVTLSANPIKAGTPFTITAHVEGQGYGHLPTGTINFQSDGKILQSPGVNVNISTVPGATYGNAVLAIPLPGNSSTVSGTNENITCTYQPDTTSVSTWQTTTTTITLVVQ